MRWATLLISGLVIGLALAGQGLTQSNPAPHTPEGHAQLALQYLRRLPASDAPYIRFLSWLGSSPANVAKWQQTLSFWLPQLSRQPDIEYAREVPGSDGLLWALDLRDWDWTQQGWRALALREPYFREPWIAHETAEALRYVICAQQDPKTFHVEGIVRADWFFRETVETDRSSSYYDLLYSQERFGASDYWPGDAQYPRNWYMRKVAGRNDGGKVDGNFPRNETDFQKAFAADVIIDALKKLSVKIRVEHGAVVEEGASIVARQNRLLWRLPILTGAYWKTFDVLRTEGDKDYAEKFPEVPAFEVKFDAGELIATLPNGGQAYLLIDGKGNRIEFADNKAAIDSSDPHDRRVRNPGSCVVCHGVGINEPRNLVQQFLKDGLDTRFRDNRRAREVRAFFLNWEKKLRQDQDGYAEYVKRTSGRKGEENAAIFKQFRDAYDAPVDLAKACAETGLTQPEFTALVQKTPHARPLMLVRGRTIPRSVWEQDTFRELMLFSVSRKGDIYAGH